MRPVNIIVALTLLFLFSCDDEPSMSNDLSIEIAGVIIDEASQEPIENVEIIGFHHGLQYGNLPVRYGESVILGTTDKCGKFKITLPDSIKGTISHLLRDSTIVILRLSRPDFGEKEVRIPFEPGTQTFIMEYSPIREAFFNSLYLVQSEDGKSVHIGWNIYSLVYSYRCPNEFNNYCHSTSDGNLYVQRSDSTMHRHIIPIEVNSQQMVTDGDLPAGNFTYSIYVGDTFVRGSHWAQISRANYDTLFLVKPPEFPTLNHCN